MTVLDERPPTEEDQRREAKARLIARWAWRRGLTWPDIRGLPWSSRSRKDLTVLRLVHEAYEESSDPEDRKRNPPSSIGSPTWVRVDFKLLAAELGREQGEAWVPEQDRLDDRDRWLAAAAVAAVEPQTGLEAREEPPTQPRGWGELAALPPLTYKSCLHHPDRRPVIITPDGGRCAGCPPRRSEIPVRWDPTPEQLTALLGKKGTEGVVVPYVSVRDGWGMHLDWTPKPCNAPLRCYCGRCPETGTGATLTEADSV